MSGLIFIPIMLKLCIILDNLPHIVFRLFVTTIYCVLLLINILLNIFNNI